MSLRLVPLDPEEVADWREAAVARRARAHTTALSGDEAAGQDRARASLALTFPEDEEWGRAAVLRVVQDDVDAGVRGVVALAVEDGGAAVVSDLDLEDLGAAPEVRQLCEAWAATTRATSLAIRVSSRSDAETAFAADPDYALVASNLALDLTAPPAPTGPVAVELRPMSERHLASYFASTVEDYAAETRQAEPSLGEEESMVAARRLFARLLPDGERTSGHEFLAAVDTAGTVVGMTWLFSSDLAGFVYDAVVEEPHRGRGLGRALMVASADRLRARGTRVLGLNVFGHNAVARHLYESLGYRVVDEVRVKPLTS